MSRIASGPSVPRIRLIATDIDGTLLNSDNQLPAANRRALEQALAQGVQLALVTARKQSSTFAIAELLGLPCACIAHNGARAWDWDWRELWHRVVDLELARDIAQFADRQSIPLVITVDEVNYYSRAYPVRLDASQLDERRVKASIDALHAPPTRIIAAGNEGVAALCDMFGREPATLVVHRYYSRNGALASAVITHPQATKQDALAALIRILDIDAAEVLTIGDAEADAGMLRWAGIGVAMGNSMPEARAAADWVAPTHDEAGFAAAISRFVL